MPNAQTRMPTQRAGRYLVQLCEHLDRLGSGGHHPAGQHPAGPHQAGPPGIRHVEWTDQHASVLFEDGRLTLDASADALTIRAEAPTADALQRLQTLLTRRLETIGRRDQLTVSW